MTKPDTNTAMCGLIAQVRTAIPFEAPQSRVCTGACDGCSRKLLDFLEGELDDWERRLAAGEAPRLGDLSRLARTSRKVYAVLERNGLVGSAPDA
ncbi:hypothetical protein [uncultured Thiodictyon sp.]|uniref:hypothetical protein n=1 Tax=uncultured Thiodictyon sp. TaxID=1846217 RepID=UPI0025EE2D9C|nr:hypothetical protein [uncultured Thiodictyon sp.]